jgi:hypothetical protein
MAPYHEAVTGYPGTCVLFVYLINQSHLINQHNDEMGLRQRGPIHEATDARDFQYRSADTECERCEHSQERNGGFCDRPAAAEGNGWRGTWQVRTGTAQVCLVKT